jgi:hypothetical protein
VSVEPVGVDHQGRPDPLGELADEVAGAVLAPDPRPEDDRLGSLADAEHLLRGRPPQVPLSAGAAHRHHLGQLHLEDVLEVGRDGDGRVAGAAPDRRQR